MQPDPPSLDPIPSGSPPATSPAGAVEPEFGSDLTADAVIATDDTLRITGFPAAAERIFGCQAADVAGAAVDTLLSPRYRAVLRRKLKQAARGAERVPVIARRSDGAEFVAELTLVAVGSPGAQGYAVVVRDLSRLRALEQELREQRRRQAEIEHLARLGSWEWDTVRDRITWSAEMYRISGLGPQEFEATYDGFLRLVHPEDREAVRAAVEEAYQRGGDFEILHRVVRPDGTERVLQGRGQVVLDAAGAPVRMTGTALDITDRHRAEQRERALHQEQAARMAAESAAARLDFLLRASELLASSLDYENTLRNVARLAVPRVADWCAVDLLDGSGVLRRVAVEHPDPSRVEMARRLHERYPPDPAVNRGIWQVIRTGAPEMATQIDDALLSSFARDAEHLRLLRALQLRSYLIVPLVARSETLGALILVQSESGRTFDQDDRRLAEELARRAAVAIDNARLVHELRVRQHQMEEQATEMELQAEELQTQAMQLEEALSELEAANQLLERRTAEAVEANRAKASFLAAMSHELRTPLNAIGGYAELIELGVHGPVTQEQLQGLTRIRRNQQYLLALINDILNFAKVEAGKVELRLDALSVDPLLSGMEALIAPQVRAKQLAYRYRTCDPDLRARGDADKVQQILLNLLGNAVKFTQPGGSVTLWCDADARWVRLQVRDNGPGIPAERLDDIFDPFVQVDRTGAGGHPQGVGLGLAISRDLARAMGGDLTVRSVEGEGSTFTLQLPRA